MRGDLRFPHLEAPRDVLRQDQDRVDCEERLGEDQAPVGAVIEGALEPLARGGLGPVLLQRDDESRQPVDPLGAHRIPLVRHRARADLLGFERLQHLVLVLQEPQVVRHLGAPLRHSAQKVEHLRILLAGVGLPRHREAGVKSHPPDEAPLKLAHLGVVAVEELEEARLRPGGPLAAAQPERLEPADDLLDVQRQVLHPERGALPDRGELRRLEMGVRQAGGGAPPERKGLQRIEHGQEPAQHHAEPLPHHHDIGVVGHEGAGGAQVDHRLGVGRLVAEVVHVRHHVVAEALLIHRRLVQVRIVQVQTHLRDRRIGDRESELLFAFGQRQPDPAPEADAVRLAPETLHLEGGVAGAERGTVAGVGHRSAMSEYTSRPSRST